MSPEEFRDILKLMVGLSMRLKTGLDFFYALSFAEVLDILEEVVELDRKQRIHNDYKNSR